MSYYIAHNDGTSKGPFKKEELIANGLTGDSLVWQQGMSQWMAASAIPELAALLAATTVAPMPEKTERIVALQHEIEQARREIEELRDKAAKLDQANLEDLIRPPLEFKDKTPYDFPCPTWSKEAWIVLACVAGHFLLGITGATKFFYIYIDLIGFVLCFVALYIGSKIKTLNKVSYAQGTPTREKGDQLARTNGWLVSITALIGIVIVMVQSSLDMFTEGMETGFTYTIMYIVIMGLLWYTNFRPIKLDNYSMQSSPTKTTNAKQKKLQQADLLRWRRERYRHGLDPHLDGEDIDDADRDSYDSYDSDSGWDNSDDSDDDWGGGESGGGGADSEW